MTLWHFQRLNSCPILYSINQNSFNLQVLRWFFSELVLLLYPSTPLLLASHSALLDLLWTCLHLLPHGLSVAVTFAWHALSWDVLVPWPPYALPSQTSRVQRSPPGARYFHLQAPPSIQYLTILLYHSPMYLTPSRIFYILHFYFIYYMSLYIESGLHESNIVLYSVYRWIPDDRKVLSRCLWTCVAGINTCSWKKAINWKDA